MEELNKLLDEVWEYRLKEDPLLASFYGDSRYNDQLPSMTLEDIKNRQVKEAEFLEKLNKIEVSQENEVQHLNFRILQQILKDQVEEYEQKLYLLPITAHSGFHIFFLELPQHTKFDKLIDYENYLQRLQKFGIYTQQYIDLMKIGIHEGYVLPKVVLKGYDVPINNFLKQKIEENPLYKPFQKFSTRISSDNQKKLSELAKKNIQENVLPAYKNLLDFLQEEYEPKCRETTSISDIPNGKRIYEYLVCHFTTLNITAEEIHEIGLKEVKRIREEMEKIIQSVNFQGGFEEFTKFLRTDSQFYVKNPDDLLKEVCYILKKSEGQLPHFFKTFPRIPCGIKKVPSYIAARMPTAYYVPPAGDGSRAGFYHVNTYDLKSRPLYELEALSLHEAIPGHHFQIALQQELKDLPAIRRFGHFTAYIEGWALYAEKLGLEMDFYQDPYRNFGRLIYEIWRACRLVVDTGLHAKGWTRQQAIDFMTENSSLTLHNIRTEIDRYIAWPGQALAYKIGELKIQELRKKAENNLGENFDLREFHDVLLTNGSLPLNILEEMVESYIKTTKSI